MSENITQLRILFAGPDDSLYAEGVWRVELTMPSDYPQSPPKVEFQTKIWHPNIGAPIQTVCLKRDWEPTLTIRDALIMISRLIIQPNLDSAINPAAAQLFQEDYQAFCHKVKPMVKEHARIFGWLIDYAREANDRGKGKPRREVISMNVAANRNIQQPTKFTSSSRPTQTDKVDPSDSEDDEASASKENDPALSPTPVTAPLPNPRRPTLGKRPLSDLPTPVDTEANDDDEAPPILSPSEQNIANNAPPLLPSASSNAPGTPPRRLQPQRFTKMNSPVSSTVPQSATGLAISTTRDREQSDQQPSSKRLRPTEGKKNVSAAAAAKAEKSSTTMPKSATALAISTTRDREESDRKPPSKRLRSAEGKKDMNAATAAKAEKPTTATLSRTRSGQVPGVKNATNNSRKITSAKSASNGSRKGKSRVGLRRL
ncbi:hypothetical protein MMC14_001497 [Varicellaria rhodocarpa]|nr:hypothetical protein [Varicellaria rhodocarpa]